MSLEEAEMPEDGSQVIGKESMGPVTKTNRRLYLVVILTLGLVLVIGVTGWLVLTGQGKEFPEGLGVILGTVAGGLVSLVSNETKS